MEDGYANQQRPVNEGEWKVDEPGTSACESVLDKEASERKNMLMVIVREKEMRAKKKKAPGSL